MDIDFKGTSGTVLGTDPFSVTSFIEEIQPIGLLQLSADLCWINLTSKSGQFLGISKSGWIHWDSFMDSLNDQWKKTLHQGWLQLKHQQLNFYARAEIQLETGNDHIFEVWLKRQPDGTVTGALRDVTNRVFQESSLAILATTQKAAGTFNFHFRLAKGSLLLSESFFSLMAAPYTDNSLSFETFRSFLQESELLRLDSFFNSLVSFKLTEPQEAIFNFHTWKGESLKVKIVSFVDVGADGNILGIMGKGMDVTKLVAAEEDARYNQELLSVMVEEAPDAVALLRIEDFSIEKINSRWAEIFRIEPHQEQDMHRLLGEYLLYLYKQTNCDDFIASLKEGVIPAVEEKLMQTFDTRQIWTRITLSITTLHKKEFLLVRILDIHSRKIADLKLASSEHRYRLLFEENPYPLFVVDKVTKRFIEVNKAAVNHYGFSKDEFLELTIMDLTKAEDVADDWNHSAGQQKPYALGDAVSTHITKEGKELYVNTFPYNIPVISGSELETQLVLVQDVTEVVKSHNALAYQQTFLREVIDTDRNLIFVKDGNGVFQIANKSVCEVFGLPVDKVIGHSEYEINGEKPLTNKYLEDDRRVLETGVPFLGEDVYIHPETGAEFFLLTYKTRIFSPDGQPLVLCVCTDLTAQRKYEKELEKSEMLFRSIWDQSPDALFIVKNDGLNIIEDCNQTAVQIFGYDTKSDLIGRDGPSLHFQAENNLLNAEETNKTNQILNETGYWAAQFRYLKKDGSIFWGNLAFTRVQYWNEDYILVRVTNIDGLRKVQEELSASLREKETLMKEIHHRVKNNMSVISGLLQLQSAYVTDKDSVDAFRESQRRIRGMALIHEQLYQTEVFAEIDFSAYLKTLCESLADTSAPSHITVEVKSQCVLVDINLAVPLGLLVNEVITNAFKHAFVGRESGKVEVTCTRNGEDYDLIISDNGIGVSNWGTPTSNRSLGVTLIKELSRQINAKLSVESENGTTFAFQFKANPRKR